VTADALVPTHPLEPHRAAFAALPSAADLAVGILPTTTAVDLRLDPALATLPAVVDVVGGPLPTTPNTWTPLAGGGRAVWLGPDEWLLVGDHHSPGWDPATREATLRDVVVPLDGAAVDVSAQRTGVRLQGSGARELLASGCALDLRPASFPPGRCAQTLLGQAGVLLIANSASDQGLDVGVRTSFARYLATWLLDAAEELGPPDTPGDAP
jgi:sarcosine oxidase, subunit gamma